LALLQGLLLLLDGLLHLPKHLVLLRWRQLTKRHAEEIARPAVHICNARYILSPQAIDSLAPGFRYLALQAHKAAAVRPGIDVVQTGQVAVQEPHGPCLSGAGIVIRGYD